MARKWQIRRVTVTTEKLAELLGVRKGGVVTQKVLEGFGLRLEGYRDDPAQMIISGHRENVEALQNNCFSGGGNVST